jgi:nucleoside-diphosphate-sugar epimerase
VRVAVTGANGFLGSHVVRQLRRGGFDVLALIREQSSDRFVRRSGADIVRIDYRDPAALSRSLDGVDALVHNAARASDWGRLADFMESNVELVGRVLGAAHAAGVRRVVHVSSNCVMGEEDSTTPKGETDPYRPRLPYPFARVWPSAMNHYRESKALGEQLALDFAREHELELTVLRPVWIFGPREFHAGPYEYARAVATGTAVFPGRRDNLFHVVYAGDVARAVQCVLEQRPSGVRVYNVGNPRVPRMQDYWGLYAKHLGVRQPALLPAWLLWPVAVLLEVLYCVFRARQSPLLTRARLYLCYANNVYDTTAITRELGFVADSDLERAVRLTVRWWQLFGFLPRSSRTRDRS